MLSEFCEQPKIKMVVIYDPLFVETSARRDAAMASDRNQSARDERAKRLRDQIAKITKRVPKGRASDAVSEPRRAESPHEFVERRMQEIAEQKKRRSAQRERES
jgi:hypothetical protein